MQPPPGHVIEAFGGSVGALVRLEGGEGRTWRAGEVVLKPASEPVYIEWLADLATVVTRESTLRVATPRQATPGEWVVDGWAAWHWLDGRHTPGSWERDLEVSDAFHAAIASAGVTMPPEVAALRNPWIDGDAVAWGQRPADSTWPDAVHEDLARLAKHLDASWSPPAAQPIHLDIGGNILYGDDQGLPPAVIDLSMHVRPAAYANAVLVTDAVAWSGAPLALALRFLARQPDADRLVARAIAFRLATAAILWPDHPDRVVAEVEGYRPVAALLL